MAQFIARTRGRGSNQTSYVEDTKTHRQVSSNLYGAKGWKEARSLARQLNRRVDWQYNGR